MSFLCLVPVRLFLSSVAILYVNGQLQRSYKDLAGYSPRILANEDSGHGPRPDVERRSRYVKLPKNFQTSKNRGPASNEIKKRKKLTCLTFLCMISLRNKTVAHIFSIVHGNGRLCKGKVVIQKFCYHGNVTSRHTSLHC